MVPFLPTRSNRPIQTLPRPLLRLATLTPELLPSSVDTPPSRGVTIDESVGRHKTYRDSPRALQERNKKKAQPGGSAREEEAGINTTLGANQLQHASRTDRLVGWAGLDKTSCLSGSEEKHDAWKVRRRAGIRLPPGGDTHPLRWRRLRKEIGRAHV